jgi:hypothetical protein
LLNGGHTREHLAPRELRPLGTWLAPNIDLGSPNAVPAAGREDPASHAGLSAAFRAGVVKCSLPELPQRSSRACPFGWRLRRGLRRRSSCPVERLEQPCGGYAVGELGALGWVAVGMAETDELGDVNPAERHFAWLAGGFAFRDAGGVPGLPAALYVSHPPSCCRPLRSLQRSHQSFIQAPSASKAPLQSLQQRITARTP